MTKKHSLTEAPISILIKNIAIPASIGFFFNTMFNVVDAYYAGKLGTSALAALSASFPVFFIILALSSGIGTAITTLIANALGKKEKDKVDHYYIQGNLLGIIVSVALSCLALVFSRNIFEAMGATGSYLDYALTYTNIIFIGTIFFVLTNTLNSYLSAVGDTKIFRNLLVGGFILNILLDPWFMYGGFGIPPMGISGIAFATILIQALQAGVLFYHLKKVGLFPSNLHLWKPDLSIMKEIVTQALPASFNMMTIAIGSFIITYFVSQYGTDAVAAYGTAIRIEQIVLLPTIGLNIAALSLTGQNNGSGNISRIKETFYLCLKYGAYVTAIGMLFLFIFGKMLMSFFSVNPNVISIGVSYLHIAAFILMAYVVSFIGSSVLQGIKKPTIVLLLSFSRQIILPIIFFTFATKVFKAELTTLWFVVLIINFLGAGLAWYLVKKELKNKEQLI